MKILFEQTKLKNLVLKNRFIRSATWEAMAEKDGSLNEEIYNFYEELAKGGVGLIITSYAFISIEEQPNLGMLGIQKDSLIDEYKKLVNTVHKHDTKIVLQIVYGGSQNDHPKKENMENILNSTKIEYFSLSRTLFSEPDLINKWKINKNHRPKCVSYNHCWDTFPNSCILRRI